MNNTIAEKRMNTKKLTVLAMFVALGYLCLFVFRFKVQFLSFEIKDVFITISGFIFGPVTAVGVALAEALLEMFTLSDTGIYGAVMNFAGSASFAASASLVYKYRKSLYGAFLGLLCGVAVMTGVMIVMNIIITPFYMKAPRSVVYSLIPTLLLPFNLIKGIFNSALICIIYKPLSEALRGIGMLPKTDSFKFDKKSALVTLVSVIVVAAAAAALIILMKGSVEWGR
ncbi:ECF transporter S component [Ruminococcus sp. Marseille-P6503]|uniref:ECF transporter S component n=1 Tax=Ruminococcus sp. Marseille-P6503 TaxID=2364796 RepID=UPI000F52A4DD|nr:ECF transporter S component [Ruminococcus sp. Marseille-P6503]